MLKRHWHLLEMLDLTLKMSEKFRSPEEAKQPALKSKFSPTGYMMA